MAIRLSRDDVLMRCAWAFSQRSTCDRYAPDSHVGVVIARAGRILVTGYNGAPAGMPHCNHACDCATVGLTGGRIVRGNHQDDCPANPKPCTDAVHAEANAIAWAAREGVSTMGGELFTTMSPCFSCAQLVVNAGIVRVVYAKPYRVTDGLVLLAAAGVEVVHAQAT
jgi:dCMP deaminase